MPRVTFQQVLLCCLFTPEAEEITHQGVRLLSLARFPMSPGPSNQIPLGLWGDMRGRRPELALRRFGLAADPGEMEVTAGHAGGGGAVLRVSDKLKSKWY